MTAWTTISNALVAVGAKPFATTIQALRDNLAASMEGSAGAPRLWLAAVERLVPGTSIRLRNDATQIVTSAIFTAFSSFSPGFLQAGTVRIAFEHRVNTNTSEVRVNRRRAGATTILTTISQTGATFVAKTYDVDVQPGDVITLSHRNTGSTNSEVRNVRLQVDAANYWWPAGDGVLGEAEGNPTITSP